MSLKDVPSSSTKLDLVHAHDSRNLAQWQLATLNPHQPNPVKSRPSAKRKKSVQLILSEDTIEHPVTGESVIRQVLLTPSAHGPPTQRDVDFLRACIELSLQHSPFAPVIEVTRHALIKIMGWSVNGKADFERVDLAARRWASTAYEFRNAWWDAEKRDWVTTIVTPFKKIELYAQVSRHPIRLHWNECLTTELLQNTKPLNLSLYFALSTAGAKQSYAYLDYCRDEFKTTRFSIPLDDYSAHVGIGKRRTNHKKKVAARKYLKDLEDHRYLTPQSDEERFTSPRRGYWVVNLELNKDHAAASPVDPLLVKRLNKHGVHHETAEWLVRNYPNRIIVQVENLEFRIRDEKCKTPDDPAAWLITAIKKKYKLPNHYKSEADKKVEEEAKLVADLAAMRAREEQEKGKREQEEERVQIHGFGLIFYTLPEEERNEIMEAVFAKKPELRTSHARDPKSHVFMGACYREYKLRHSEQAVTS